MAERVEPDPLDTRTYSPAYKAAVDKLRREVETLRPEEETWRAKVKPLRLAGYQLRHRYNEEHILEWHHPGNEHIDFRQFEDSIYPPPRLNIMDAVQIKTQNQVFLKRVRRDSKELAIARYLKDRTKADENNHCVPILDILEEPEVFGDEVYIVMPCLRPLDDPPFEIVDNIVDLVNQLLEGLEFMHSIGIAHRDCAYKNVMMDATSLYPKGFHPVRQSADLSGLHPAERLSRENRYVRYYFVDFGISTKFERGQPRRVFGQDGLDQDVPELSLTTAYDPFKVDVFIIGNLMKSVAFDKYANVSFLLPLILDMTQHSPSQRPDAAQALQRWRKLRAGISFIQRYSRLQGRGEMWVQTLVLDSLRVGRKLVSWITDTQG